MGWSGGIDSVKLTTVQSDKVPDGIRRDQLCWLDNGRLRDGGITPRAGFLLSGTIHDGSALFQGKFMYEPIGANPYEMYSIGGRIYKVDVENFAVTDLSAAFALANPPDVPFAFFVQGEEFLVIQAGDGSTLPLFWDGATLRRSAGLAGGELPAATCMEYYLGRIWYAQDRLYTAGDIVLGASGTAAYGNRDSVLKVTENPLAVGGDGFVVPSQDGNIRALKAGGAIDAALGQGRLFIFTRKAVYALQVPITRTSWIAADNNNQPLQTVVQLINGSVNDRSVVAVNGDLFYQSLEPGIRSLQQSVRYFTQWGNVEISSNEQRILNFNNRDLMRGSTGIFFDNRLLESALPKQTPQGIVHQALIPLDVIPISSFNQQKQPNWEGMYEGVDILQMATGDFGGRDRAFATVVSRGDGDVPAGTIQLWEITNTSRTDKVDGGIDGGNRVTTIAEFPAFTWAGSIGELNLKKLVMAEIGVDRVFGTVDFFLQWRPDSAACWINWHQWKECSPKNINETVAEPIAYPLPECLESYRATMRTPKPPENCAQPTGRPAHIGFQMQCRLIWKGFARIRSFILYAEPVEQGLYRQITC